MGQGLEQDWPIQDMVDEVKSWKHTRGAGGHIIFESGSENTVQASKEAVGKPLGGRVIPEPAERITVKRENKKAGKTLRGTVRVLKDWFETEAGIKMVIAMWCHGSM